MKYSKTSFGHKAEKRDVKLKAKITKLKLEKSKKENK